MNTVKLCAFSLFSLMVFTSAHATCEVYPYSTTTKTINTGGGKQLSGQDGLRLTVDQVGRSQINAFGQGFLHAPNLCTTGDGSALLVNGTLVRLSEGKSTNQTLSGNGTNDNPYSLSTSFELNVRGEKVASIERIDEYHVPDFSIKTTFKFSDLKKANKYKFFFIKDTHLEYDFDPSPNADKNDKVRPFKNSRELGVYRLKDNGKNKTNLLMKYVVGETPWNKYSVKGYRDIANLLSITNGREKRGLDNVIQPHPDDTGIGLEWDFSGQTEFSTTIKQIVSRYLLNRNFTVKKTTTGMNVTMMLSNPFDDVVTEPSKIWLNKALTLNSDSIQTTCSNSVSIAKIAANAKDYQLLNFSEQTLDKGENCQITFTVIADKDFKPTQHVILDATGEQHIDLESTDSLRQQFVFKPSIQRLLNKSELKITLNNENSIDLNQTYTFKLDKDLSVSLDSLTTSVDCTETPTIIEKGMVKKGYRTYQVSSMRYSGKKACTITLPVTLTKRFNDNARAVTNLDGKIKAGLTVNHQPQLGGLALTTYIKEREPKAYTHFGTKIAQSKNLMIVGNGSEYSGGKIDIYELKNNQWKLTQSLAGQYKYIAINADETMIAVNAPKAQLTEGGETFTGLVYLYQKQPNGLWEKTQILHSDTPTSNSKKFGEKIIVSNNYIIISEPKSSPKKVHIFKLSSGIWQASNVYKGSGYSFAADIALSNNTLFIGEYNSNNGSATYSGNIYAIDLKSCKAMNCATRIVSANPQRGGYFGKSLSASKNQLLVSEPGAKTVHIYTYDSTNQSWQIDDKLIETSASRKFASSMAGNNQVIYIADHLANNATGQVLQYQKTVNGWEKISTLTGYHNGAHFGYHVSAFGKRLLVSARKEKSKYKGIHNTPVATEKLANTDLANSGAAYMYEPDAVLMVKTTGLTSTVNDQPLVLQNNHKDDLFIAENGQNYFLTHYPLGSNYDVTIAKQPRGHICKINSPSKGTMAITKVVSIICQSKQKKYSLSLNVNGLLANETLKLTFNGKAKIINNGKTLLASAIPYNDDYAITALQAPTGKSCNIDKKTPASGKITDNTTINVNCSASQFAVSALVSGLDKGEKLTLVFNGQSMTAANNTKVIIANDIAYGTDYTLVLNSPSGKTCEVSPSLKGSIKTNTLFAVKCSAKKQHISIKVSGLVKSNDGQDALIIKNRSDNQSITFDKPTTAKVNYIYPYGQRYEFEIIKQPKHMQCSFTQRIGLVKGNLTLLVDCSGKQYTLSANVQGLASGETLELTNNAKAPLTWKTNTTKTFGDMTSGTGFDVAVKTQPKNQHCQISQGKGEMLKTHTVSVNCGNQLPPKTQLPLYLLSDVNKSRIIGVADINQDGTFSDNERNVYFDTTNKSGVGKNNGTLTDTLINDFLVDEDNIYLVDLHAQAVYLAKDKNRNGDVQDASEIHVWFSEENAGKLPMPLPQAVVKGKDNSIYILSPGLENATDPNKKLDRIYRTTDKNGDGDANDLNEASIYADLSTVMTPLYTGFDPSAGLDLAISGDTMYLLDTQGLGNGLIFSIRDTDNNGSIEKTEVKKAFAVEEVFSEDAVIHKIVANAKGIHIVFTPYYYYDHSQDDYADYPASKRRIAKLVDRNQDGVFDPKTEMQIVWDATTLVERSRFYYSWAFDFDNQNNLIMVSNETQNYTGSGVWLINHDKPKHISLLAGGSGFMENHKETAISEVRAIGITTIPASIQPVPPKPKGIILKDSFE